jgi:hypothetical protein
VLVSLRLSNLQTVVNLFITSPCRIGHTCRCIHSALLGTPTLPGAQAQYIRIPHAGGTLHPVDRAAFADAMAGAEIPDAALLLLADILPTGVFAAIQALEHPKVRAVIEGVAYPGLQWHTNSNGIALALAPKDKTLTFAIVGLGPVGLVRTYFSCPISGNLQTAITVRRYCATPSSRRPGASVPMCGG